MGVEDEYGETFPADRVLNGKRPLNFLLEEPTQLRYIDATFALHRALAEHPLNFPRAEKSRQSLSASGYIRSGTPRCDAGTQEYSRRTPARFCRLKNALFLHDTRLRDRRLRRAKRTLFSNPDITTSYSIFSRKKNAKADSLLPALDGDAAFAELLRENRTSGVLNASTRKEVLTRLKAQIIYIDGIREDPYCILDKNDSNTAGSGTLKSAWISFPAVRTPWAFTCSSA